MLFVVGKSTADTPHGVVWELQGVFTTPEAAEAAASGHPDYWIGPLEADTLLPDDTAAWPGVYFQGESPHAPA
jgi:hypothetical protein